jgi:hypothetical protein
MRTLFGRQNFSREVLSFALFSKQLEVKKLPTIALLVLASVYCVLQSFRTLPVSAAVYPSRFSAAMLGLILSAGSLPLDKTKLEPGHVTWETHYLAC